MPLVLFEQAILYHFAPERRATDAEQRGGLRDMAITGMPCLHNCLDFGMFAGGFQGDRDIATFCGARWG